ncbi:MAG TPA: putative lipid II flippase FtsW [Candidatus Limnocylindria bacterium]|nr:putative lipid II flippase FtsW [Candidatus Limnocylindria bacterium]
MRLPRTTHYDVPLAAAVMALLALGLLMVYSASGIRALDALDEPRYFFVQQSVWAALGVVAMIAAARVDYHRYRKVALPLLVLAVALLAVVLVPGVGTSVGGASRWLRLTPFAGIQPAELAKLALIVYLAFWCARRRAEIGHASFTLPFLLITGAVVGLIVAEPDLGTAVVLVAIAMSVYFVAGARIREFAAIALLALVAVATLAVVQPYRLQRVLTFLDPWEDPRGAGFQTIQSLYGLALGGAFGEGLGAGKEKFGFLPAAYTDSIFAVLGNELGLVGTLGVIVLFLALALRGTRIALRAPDPEGALLATGITAWLAFQAWLNMAVVASLVPMTGITLPFISYGGSSLCVGLIAVGILLSVGRQGAQVADVPRAARRRRDGRAHQPAPRGGRGGGGPRPGRALPLRRWSTRSRG